MSLIAGHTFKHGFCTCGIRWIDIRYADENAFHDDPSVKKWAHAGRLNEAELEQIREEVKAEEKRIENAMKDVAK